MGRRWGGGRAGAVEIAWEEAREEGATGGCGRAKAWEEARNGGARSKGMIRWDGGGTGGGRAGAAEIEWEEAREGGADDPVGRRWTSWSSRNSMGGRAVDEPWTG